MAARTQTTMATCAWNRMGRLAQPKRCILGLTLGLWVTQDLNQAAIEPCRATRISLSDARCLEAAWVREALQAPGFEWPSASELHDVALYNV